MDNTWHVLRYWPNEDANTAELVWIHAEEDDAAWIDGLEDSNGGTLRWSWISEAEALRMIDNGEATVIRNRRGWSVPASLTG